MSSRSIRDGKGDRAYRRRQAALKRRTARENRPCRYGSPTREGCGQPIDTTLPMGDRMSLTADHPHALENGGHLTRQELVPMHRSGNSRKGHNAPIDISVFAAS